MAKKNILLVIDNLGSGGAQNQLTLLAKKLAEEDYQITLVTYFPQDFFKSRIQHSRIQHVELKKTNQLGLNVFWQLKNIIRNGNIDVMLSFLDSPNFYLSAARKIAFSKIPIVISYRSQTIFSKMGKTELWLKKWMNRNATAIIANSHHERESWIERYPKLKDKFYTFYNAVDLEKFKPNFSNQQNEQFRILCVGSISIDKNGLTVIEALNQLINKHKADVKLTWVGQKVTSIKSRREYLGLMTNSIQKYNLTDHWEWQKPVENINDYYNSHDVLVHASMREGLPNVVCEAISCGLPVILSDVLDHPRLAKLGNNGRVFDPRNPNELAEKILEMKDNSSSIKKGDNKNAIASARNEFSIEKFIESYLNLFNSFSN